MVTFRVVARLHILFLAALTVVASGFLPQSGRVHAQENAENLPAWRIVNICRNDSAVGQCKLYEEVARQKLVSAWTIIPPEWRERCLLQFTPPLEPSWRILADCIDGEVRRAETLQAKKLDAFSRAEAERLKETQEAARKRALAAAQAEEAARKAEEEARLKAEAEEAARKAEEEARLKAEAEEAARKAEEEARLKTEAEEAARKAEEEARLKAEAEEAARKAEEEARLKAEAEEAARKAKEARLKAEAEEAARQAEIAAKAAAEDARRKAEAEEAARIAAEKARIAAEEERLSKVERNCRDKIRAIIEPDPIKFRSGRSRVRKVAREQLDKVVEIATACPTVKFRIEGHTDSRGDDRMNLWLSRQRAQAVVDHLVRKGLDPTRVRPVGYGEERPIADNRTSTGRRLNRRIDFNVELSQP